MKGNEAPNNLDTQGTARSFMGAGPPFGTTKSQIKLKSPLTNEHMIRPSNGGTNQPDKDRQKSS